MQVRRNLEEGRSREVNTRIYKTRCDEEEGKEEQEEEEEERENLKMTFESA